MTQLKECDSKTSGIAGWYRQEIFILEMTPELHSKSQKKKREIKVNYHCFVFSKDNNQIVHVSF